jgi:hypothetical protein
MFNRKSLFAAAALAVVSVAGVGSASADTWTHVRMENHQIKRDEVRDHAIRNDIRHQEYRDAVIRHDERMDRRYIDGVRLHDVLWRNHYRVIGNPYFVRDRYVVRTYNRFGHIVLVQVDPWSGAFLGEVRL